MNQFLYSVLAVIPSYFIAIKVPNAFISVLGFAGMILAVIAILLPLFLLYKVSISGKELVYSELKSGIIPVVLGVFGFTIICCEIFNMLQHT